MPRHEQKRMQNEKCQVSSQSTSPIKKTFPRLPIERRETVHVLYVVRTNYELRIYSRYIRYVLTYRTSLIPYVL